MDGKKKYFLRPFFNIKISFYVISSCLSQIKRQRRLKGTEILTQERFLRLCQILHCFEIRVVKLVFIKSHKRA